MKKKLFLITMIIIAVASVFTGCGSKTDSQDGDSKTATAETTTPDPNLEYGAFEGFGFTSAQTILDGINSNLSSAGISFSKFEPVEDHVWPYSYYRSESSSHIVLKLTIMEYGSEHLIIYYDQADPDAKTNKEFETVVKAVISLLGDPEDTYDKLMDPAYAEAAYETPKYMYQLTTEEELAGYLVLIGPVTNKDKK